MYDRLKTGSLESFRVFMSRQDFPVILLEGTRQVPEKDFESLVRFGAMLAREFPQAVFRSGNAEGSDSWFARGVESVDPSRLQIVTPTAGHRRKNVHPRCHVVPLSRVSTTNEEQLAFHTNAATPENRRVIDLRNQVPVLKTKANYLLRDTLKVMGDREAGLAPATVAFFYTKPDPMSGGTGHTIRVCRQCGVQAVLQDVWMGWL